MHFCIMANSKSDQSKLAREYFLTTDKTQAEIAKLVGVTAKTLGKWKEDEGWELLKAATNVTPRKTIAGFYLQLESLRKSIQDREEGKNFPDSKESDIIMKISKSIKMLQKSLTLTDYINAFEDLTKFALRIDPALAKSFISIINEFIQVKTKELKD
jgi:DNA-binding XRE family transcriptional regulator